MRKVFSLTTCVVALDGFGLDDNTRVAALVELALVRDCTHHVTARQYHSRQNDDQKDDSFLSHKGTINFDFHRFRLFFKIRCKGSCNL